MSGWRGDGRPPRLPAEFERGAGPSQVEDAGVDERVVNDAVGMVERVQCQRREQPRIARPGADQPDAAGSKVRKLETRAVDHAATL